MCVMFVIHSNADCCTLADCTIPSSDQSLEAPLTWVLISRDILLHFTEECPDFLPPCLYFSFTEFRWGGGGVRAIHKPGCGVEAREECQPIVLSSPMLRGAWRGVWLHKPRCTRKNVRVSGPTAL